MKRAHCQKCDYPKKTCVCSFCPEVSLPFELKIFQHLKEKEQKFGTAKLIQLAVKESEIIPFSPEQFDKNFNENDLIIFYDQKASPLQAVDFSEKKNLILLDGTWSQCRNMISSCPRLDWSQVRKLEPQERGNYPLRPAPFKGALSTYEALLEILRLSSSHSYELGQLSEFFTRFIQLQFQARN